jgi:hypothetical protein
MNLVPAPVLARREAAQRPQEGSLEARDLRGSQGRSTTSGEDDSVDSMCPDSIPSRRRRIGRAPGHDALSRGGLQWWRGDGGLCAREYLCWAGMVERGVRASAKAENTCPSSWSCRLTVRSKATTLHPTRSSALPRVSGDEQRRTSHPLQCSSALRRQVGDEQHVKA